MPIEGVETTETTLINLTGQSRQVDAVSVIERGLPKKAFERLRLALGVPQHEMAKMVMIPVRTLSRRDRLQVPESDRVFRIGLLFQRSLEVLGEADAARHWMQSPKKAFDGYTPLEMARTEIGARKVETLLGQLEHGVFA